MGMHSILVYLDYGWDFVGETENGTQDIWWMPDHDYPRLSWELVVDDPLAERQE